MPTPPDCEATARPPGGGTDPLKVASREMSGRLLISPRQFGPTIRMLRRRARSSIARCIAAPSSPSSSKPEEMTTAAGMPASAASSRVASTRVAGTATTARSTRPGTSTRRGRAGTPPTSETVGCTACTVAGEATGDDRAEHGGAHAGAVATYAGDRHAARIEEGLEGAGLGPALPLVRGVQRGRRRGGVHLDLDAASLHGPRDREAGVDEDAEHAVVLTQDLGDEAAQASFPTGCGEVLEKQAARTETVQGVVDQERHLRGTGLDGLRGTEGDQAAVPLDDEGQGPGIVAQLTRRRPGPPDGWG